MKFIREICEGWEYGDHCFAWGHVNIKRTEEDSLCSTCVASCFPQLTVDPVSPSCVLRRQLFLDEGHAAVRRREHYWNLKHIFKKMTGTLKEESPQSQSVNWLTMTCEWVCTSLRSSAKNTFGVVNVRCHRCSHFGARVYCIWWRHSIEVWTKKRTKKVVIRLAYYKTTTSSIDELGKLCSDLLACGGGVNATVLSGLLLDGGWKKQSSIPTWRCTVIGQVHF